MERERQRRNRSRTLRFFAPAFGALLMIGFNAPAAWALAPDAPPAEKPKAEKAPCHSDLVKDAKQARIVQARAAKPG